MYLDAVALLYFLIHFHERSTVSKNLGHTDFSAISSGLTPSRISVMNKSGAYLKARLSSIMPREAAHITSRTVPFASNCIILVLIDVIDMKQLVSS